MIIEKSLNIFAPRTMHAFIILFLVKDCWTVSAGIALNLAQICVFVSFSHLRVVDFASLLFKEMLI